jgi:hypothetical protein
VILRLGSKSAGPEQVTDDDVISIRSVLISNFLSFHPSAASLEKVGKVAKGVNCQKEDDQRECHIDSNRLNL